MQIIYDECSLLILARKPLTSQSIETPTHVPRLSVPNIHIAMSAKAIHYWPQNDTSPDNSQYDKVIGMLSPFGQWPTEKCSLFIVD